MENQKVYRTDNDEDVAELRRQIKGNLMIAVDTWPINQLIALEDKANRLATAGIVSEGLMFQGLMDVYNLIYDKQGKTKLSFNPDDDDNLYKILAKQIEKNDARFAEINKSMPWSSTETKAEKPQKSWDNPEDDYSKFF